jgi:hypothetical protein
LQVNGLYAAMKNGNVLGGRVQVYGDIRGDDFLNRQNNGVTGLTVWNFSVVESSQNDVTNFWTFAYQAINQCNVFIDGVEANQDKFVPPTFPADYAKTANNYVAEARFVRAVLYHYMLQFYARPFADGAGAKPGLPLRLTGNKDSNNNDLERAPVSAVYDQIIADLDFAETNLPLSYGTDAVLNTTRAHRNTAIAFKTRVYLTKGDYAKVISEASKIVPSSAPYVASSGVPNTLMPNVTDVFFGSQTSAETILSMPFNPQNAPGTQNALGFYYRVNAGTNPGGGEYSLNTAAGSIFADNAAWPVDDKRRTNFVYQQGTEYYIGGKYPSASPFLDRAPVIRYAEVILNYAEALARTNAGVNAQALDMLNAVRTRSTASAWAPASQTELENDILTERRIEFLGEGLRTQDITRLLQPFPAKASAPSVDPSNAAYVWPIPLSERLTNSLIVQNQ